MLLDIIAKDDNEEDFDDNEEDFEDNEENNDTDADNDEETNKRKINHKVLTSVR